MNDDSLTFVNVSFVYESGASPVFDFMLHLIRARFGHATALDVAGVFSYDEAHPGTEAQPLASLGRLGRRGGLSCARSPGWAARASTNSSTPSSIAAMSCASLASISTRGAR